MNRVTLPGTAINTTVLGFGCSALLGPKSRAEALRLLGAAYDAGVRHFDVARYYGYGDAEGVLGEFLRGCREPVTVTTKFGIQPIKMVKGLPSAVGVARRLMRVTPGLRRLFGRGARGLVRTGAFSAADARAALETSLRELGREPIDVYLLHDCQPSDCEAPELQAFLEDAVRRGWIRAFGVGTGLEAIRAIDARRPAFTRVVQFNPERLGPLPLPADPSRAVITHGAVSTHLSRTRQRMASDPRLARTWSEALGVDIRDPDVLAGLLLAAAVAANAAGVVLYQSTRVDSVSSNARAIGDRRYTAEQVDRFLQLWQRLL